MAELVFQYIDHDLTRPTLLTGPDGCGKTQYARRILDAAGYEVLEVASDSNLTDNLRDLACGRGFVSRSVVVTEFETLIKDKAFIWKQLTDVLAGLFKLGTVVMAIADCSQRRLPLEVKRIFYVVAVQPPSPSQICDILQKHNRDAIPPHHASKIAFDCCGDVRQALIAVRHSGTSLKDMHVYSDVDERLGVLLSCPQTSQIEDLIELSMLPILFDNYTNLPISLSTCQQIAEGVSMCDVFVWHQENGLAYATIASLCTVLSGGGKQWASKFMGSKRDNTLLRAAKRLKLLQSERNSLLAYTNNPDLEYMSGLAKIATDPSEYGLTAKRIRDLGGKVKLCQRSRPSKS